jgi:hypothetical protein
MHRTLLSLALLAAPAVAGAQAYNYPALQMPVIAEREYNFAAASSGRAGTSLLFQWREAVGPQLQVSLDAGLAAPDRKGLDTRLLLAGGVAYQLTRANADFPFDVAATGGVGFATAGDARVVRVPVGASVGHTFAFDGGVTLTPYVHPRLSFDSYDPKVGPSDSKLNVDVDLGANLALTNQVALRLAVLLGGADYNGATNGVGFSVAWTPKGLKK